MKVLPKIAATLLMAAATLASAQDIKTTVNGVLVYFPDVEPMMLNGRVMVPLRGVFEHVDAHVQWNAESRTVICHRAGDELRLPIGSYHATLNGTMLALDTPAILVSGRTMIPLRFTSEALGASVDWIAETKTVQINTVNAPRTVVAGFKAIRLDAGTVIPFRLDHNLSSNGATVGQKFWATIDTNGAASYQGLPTGTTLEGRVSTAKPKTGDTPGVLGLAFDRVRLPDGSSYAIHGSLIGLDSKSVYEDANGRLIARSDSRSDNLKYVGYGAGAGVLLAIATKGNVLTNALIGGALGYLFGEIQKNPSKARDVSLAQGTKFGVRLNSDLAVRVPSNGSAHR